jgi:hypothetical protein
MVYLYLAATYFAVCYVTFKFPQLFHKVLSAGAPKRSKFNNAWLIAHRGGSFEAPENTIQAFRNAAAVGVDFMELDVFATSDNVIIVSHDNNLKRLCGVDVNITESRYEDLPPVLNTFPTHFSSAPLTFPDTYELLKLEDLFKEFPNYPIVGELKEVTPKALDEIERLMIEYNRSEADTCFNAVHGQGAVDTRNRLRKYSHSFAPMSTVYKIFFTYFIGLIGLVKLEHKYICLPNYTPSYQRIWDSYNVPVGAFLYLSFCKFAIAVSGPLNAHL